MKVMVKMIITSIEMIIKFILQEKFIVSGAVLGYVKSVGLTNIFFVCNIN